MKIERAYSLLEVKSIDEEKREITGIATTPSTDKSGDIIESKGAEFKLPLPLLWHHDPRQPIGHVISAKVTSAGIEIKAKLANIEEPGVLKDRLDEAWQSMKANLVRGLSIGFKPLEAARIEGTYGTRFIKWLWLELSAVTIADNGDATIQTIKSIDTEQRAALGKSPLTVVRLDTPAGDSATSIKSPKSPKGKNMNIAEQIQSFQAAREKKAARVNELMTKAAETGTTLDAAESEEYDNLDAEVKSINVHLARLESMQKSAIASAKPVDGTSSDAAAASRSPATVKAAPVLPKGTAFTRFVIAQARAKGNLVQAAEIAKQWKDSTPEVETVLKAAMAAGTTTDADWAAPLVPYQQMASEFIELLRPATIVGKLNLRRVPFNVRIPGQTQGSTVNWVGETKPKPVSELKFEDITLRYNKLAGIVVISDELARLSTPSAEAIISGDLIAQIAQFMDVSFISPASSAITDVRPASVTNGVTPIVASGADADALRVDIRALFAQFIAANLSVADAVWITTPTLAMAVGMLQNALGQPEFPGIGANGGTLMGIPVVVSESVPTDTSGTLLVLAKQSEILLADDGGVAIDVSREASLQMNSTPDDPTTASTVLTSLWQQNLVGIRAERWVTWRKRRATAVGYISGANYGAA